MEEIEIWTLVDVTHTGVNRANKGTHLAHDQHRNFVTLLQCLELRSIISYSSLPQVKFMNLDDLSFGTDYTGTHRVWYFRFLPDRVDVYFDSKHDATGLLNDDMNGVPIIKNLTETINMSKAIFNCRDPFSKNTIIKAQSGTFQRI
jgi:hypothetical protein